MWSGRDGAERAAGAPEAAAATGLDASAVGPGATGTNVQEVGVDEPDLLKSADGRLVAVRGERLYVLDVTGDEPRELGSVSLPAGTAGELLLSGDRALVAWTAMPVPGQPATAHVDGVEPAPDRAASTMPAYGSTAATLTVVDLADPSAPTVVHSEEIEGTYISARERDGVVRVVLQSTPWQPFANSATAGQSHPRSAAAAHDGHDGGDGHRSNCAARMRDVRHPAKPRVPGGTVLTLASTQAEMEPLPGADGNLVYASTQDSMWRRLGGCMGCPWHGSGELIRPTCSLRRDPAATTTDVGSGRDGATRSMGDERGRRRLSVAKTRGTTS